ncbi:MAG: hypothetical protein JSR66_05475 [Proteobacteria bacterium]|nr:hypothetical protein [Pseudomonadota bacterium]
MSGLLEVWLDSDLSAPCQVNGWRLAPAFDVNPNIDKADHVLNIDDSDNRPGVELTLSTATFYGLPEERALNVVEEVAAAVDRWRNVAQRQHISRADVELTAAAFNAHSEFRKSRRRV